MYARTVVNKFLYKSHTYYYFNPNQYKEYMKSLEKVVL
jgi:hypothetical protein